MVVMETNYSAGELNTESNFAEISFEFIKVNKMLLLNTGMFQKFPASNLLDIFETGGV